MPRLVSLLAALLLVAGQLLPVAAQVQPDGLAIVTVSRVVDGDTVDIVLPDGRGERLRLIGIDTPETKHPSKPIECYGPEASARTAELLAGKAAGFELDVQQRDRYGRLLGYLWLDGRNISVQLAEEGYAVQLTIAPNVRYVDNIRAAVVSAREQARGLWAACYGLTPPESTEGADYQPTTEDQPAASEPTAEPTTAPPAEPVAQPPAEQQAEPTATATPVPPPPPTATPVPTATRSPRAAPQGRDCPSTHRIKGNINSRGERIYHVPGGQFYDVTIPEACFATEADAVAAGYRRSLR